MARCATISSTVTASFARKRRNFTCSARSSASFRIDTVCRSLTRCTTTAPFFLTEHRRNIRSPHLPSLPPANRDGSDRITPDSIGASRPDGALPGARVPTLKLRGEVDADSKITFPASNRTAVSLNRTATSVPILALQGEGDDAREAGGAGWGL